MSNSMQPGDVVISNAGRDRGKLFIVVSAVDDNFVTIANGRQRLIASPKLKKIKHLEPTHEVALNLRNKLLGNMPIFDAEIRKTLAEFESKLTPVAAATKE